MTKKLITACMAIAAFAAFGLPATASATNNPDLTVESIRVKTGTGIVGTNIGNTLFLDTNGNTLVTCTDALMTGTLKTNVTGTVEGEISKAEFSGTGAVHADNGLPECTGSFGNAYITVRLNLCLRSTPTMTTDEFTVNGGTCAAPGNVKFIIGSTTAGACEYETATSVKGDYTTVPKEAELTTRPTIAGSGAKKITGGFLCPSSGMLKMTFGLETHGGNSMTIS